MPVKLINKHASFRRVAALSFLLCLCATIQAQPADTLALIRQLIQAGSAYKQPSLYLEMELKNSTNFMISEDDTASTHISFYLLPHASYVRMGEAEQIINDSMALVVSDKMQHMMLDTDARTVLRQMKAFAGPAWQDSSAVQIAARYTVQRSDKDMGRYVFQVIDKRLLYSTSLPRESMELQFDARTNRPLEMITIKRTLVPLNVSDYTSLQRNAELADKLVNREDKEYYLIREQVARFVYKAMSNDAGLKIPVVMTDRISRNSQGTFQPVGHYEHYALTVN